MFSGVYSNFNSFIADEYRHALIYIYINFLNIFNNFGSFEVSWSSKLFKRCVKKKWFSYYNHEQNIWEKL